MPSRASVRAIKSRAPSLEYLEDRTVLSSTPIGIEELINTTEVGDQRLASIGSKPMAGQSVIAWVSTGEDGSEGGIYAQRYDLFGGKVGSPFRVNEFTAGHQTAPSVALDSLGSFVITWQSAGQDGSGDGIYARRFAYDATPLSSDFRVNSFTTADQRSPAIAMNDSGDFAISFHSPGIDGSGPAVMARVYRSNGAAIGNEFQVNQFSENDQQLPAIAMDSSGGFAVAWQSTGQDASGSAIVARRYNRDGVALADEFVVNQFTSGNQSRVSISSNLDGSLVIAWQSGGQDGSGSGVIARLFDAAGSPVGNEFIVNEFRSGNQVNPRVASTSTGGFVVAWQSQNRDGDLDAILAKRYSSGGTAVAPEFTVNTVTAGSQTNPAVMIDSQGDFAVAWQSPSQEPNGASSIGVFLRRYNAGNDAPVMGQIFNQAIDVGGTVAFTAQAKDADGSLDTLTYLLGAGAPAGMLINPNTGEVTWDTSSGVNPGRYFATVQVTDLAGAVDAKDVAITLFAPGERSPLDDYVNVIQPEYAWDIRSRVDGEGFTKYNILLKSGTWRSPSEVSKPLWEHWIALYVPDVIRSDRAFVFVDAGSAQSSPPSSRLDAFAGPITAVSGMVIADLFNVPNQPLTFAGESFTRSEDSTIAYSWRRYIETGDPTWPVNLPMTRAAMRAMDAVADFVGSPVGGNFDIESFVMAGGSKRGWTTWLASATDPRVSSAVPVVADLLNLEESFVHHFAHYNGTFSPTVIDYVNEGILTPNNFGRDEYRTLLSIVDPYTYKSRLTLPKFMVNASGDEFFVPDSWKFYYDELPGPKAIRYVPNTGHSINDPAILLDVFSILIPFAAGYQIPEYAFTQLPDGTIELTTAAPVVSAQLVQATNPNGRDFRFREVGAIFTSTNIVDQGTGVFRANVPTPVTGSTAYYVQVSLATPTGGIVTVSSGLYFKGDPANQRMDVIPVPDVIVTEGSFSVPLLATDRDQTQTLSYSLDSFSPSAISVDPITGLVSGFADDQLGLLPPITVIISDNGTPVISYREEFRITVVNAPPSALLTGPAEVLRGQPGSWSLTATDPSPIDQAAPFTFEIDWTGDGIPDETISALSGTTISRALDGAGPSTVSIWATDKDGGRSQQRSWSVDIRTYTVDDGQLTWFGTTGLDVVSLSLIQPGIVQIIETMLNGQLAGGIFDVEGVNGIVIAKGSGGNDTLDASALAIATQLFGEEGDDLLLGGSEGDTLVGDVGGDTIYGGLGNDSIDGGDNSDLLFGESPQPANGIAYGMDTINGGEGNDKIYGDGDGGEGVADLIYGDAGDDTIIGDGTSGHITGTDSIFGGSGNDTIVGDPDGAEGAMDSLVGGDGDDFVVGGRLRDTLEGGIGDDILLGGDGGEGATEDSISGGDGRDILVGDGGIPSPSLISGGADTLDGGAGEDIVVAGFVFPNQAHPIDFILIRSEWTSNRSFQARVDNLTGLSATPSSNSILSLNGNIFNDVQNPPSKPNVDNVFGGEDADWIFADVAHDITSDLLPGVDQLVDLALFPLASN
jgi:PhoPQ-activated pathogenicity-related protein/Ca2+-binding RTX toxin-like protein